MTRVRTNNVFGTTTDNPLTDSATTMNSAGLANLAAVSSAEAIITLDPNRVNGAPEIVVVTAHTGSATSATIQRGQFGTSARQHAQGTEWVHGPITTNATSYVTAADDQGDYVPMNAWESYTPTLTNITLGSGTSDAAYIRIGRTIHWRWSFLLGAGSAIGSAPTISLPVAASAGLVLTAAHIGTGNCFDANGAEYPGVAVLVTTTTARFAVFNASATHATIATVTATLPFSWTTSDRLLFSGTYEAAS